MLLSIAYRKGWAVERNEDLAASLLETAARADYVPALNTLGNRFYSDKVGRPSDAVELWKRSAVQGSAKALRYLGDAYSTGKGVRRDRAQAMDYYKAAAGRGDLDARDELKRLAR